MTTSDLHQFDVVIFVFELTEWETAGRRVLLPIVTRLRGANKLPPAIAVGCTFQSLRSMPLALDVPGIPAHFGFWAELPFIAVSLAWGDEVASLSQKIADLHHPRKSTLLSWIGNMLTGIDEPIFNTIASIFPLPIPENVNRDTLDMLDLTSDDVDALIQSPETMAWDKDLQRFSIYGNGSQYKIPHGLFAKLRQPGRWEVEHVQFVRQNTKIPVPQPRYLQSSSRWMLSDFIEGRSLANCWDEIGGWMRFRVACTLRLYIRQLRQLTSKQPGSPVDGICRGPLFNNQKYGPFGSSSYFKNLCGIVAHGGWRRTIEEHPYPAFRMIFLPPPGLADGGWPLVFTHGDLNLTNVILANDKSLWIVGWENAGFFPVWLETVGMGRNNDEDWGPSGAKRLFVADRYLADEYFWAYMMESAPRADDWLLEKAAMMRGEC